MNNSNFDYEFGNNYGLINIDMNDQNVSYNFQLKEDIVLNYLNDEIIIKERNFFEKYNNTSTAFISCLLAFVIFMI